MTLLVVWLLLFVGCHCQEPSQIVYDDFQQPHSQKDLSQGAEINPSRTVDMDDYLVSHINETSVSYPYFHSLFLLDLQIVRLLQNVTSDGRFDLHTQHKILILRYIEDWKENICSNCTMNISLKFSIPGQLRTTTAGLRISRRLQMDLQKILQFSRSELWTREVAKKVQEFETDVGMRPENIYVTEYGLGLMRLAETYDKTPQDIQEQASIHLTRGDMIDVSLEAFELQHYGSSLQWMSFAERSMALSSNPLPNLPEYIAIVKNVAIFYHEKYQQMVGFGNSVGNFPVSLRNKKLEEQMSFTSKKPLIHNESPVTWRQNQYKRLCQGIEVRSPKIVCQLKCKLDRLGSPWLFMMPAKIEQISKDPPIVLFHDLVRNATLHHIRRMAMPIQMPAKIRGSENEGPVLALSKRMSYVSWLHETVLGSLTSLEKFIGAVTGLRTSDQKNESEAFQINLYGPGGHYEVHMDSMSLYEKNNTESVESKVGDRISTLMIYLNEVESGGRTVFPYIGVSVEPVEGSAVYWPNLFRSGRTDRRMHHAGCPVLSGFKWVCNRWIRHNAQVFNQPCLAEDDFVENQYAI